MNKLDIEKITNNRLWELMKDKEITDSKSFARLLIDKGFYIFDNLGDKFADSTSNEYKQYYKNVDTLSKTITHCLYDNCYKKDNLLIACCRFFKCSADYLLGFIDLPTHADTDINKETGLSKDAINCLHMLHTPLDPSCSDSMQDSRYDIIALNIILEDLYTNFKNEEEWKTFSADSILNQIGQYIDSNSVNFGIKTSIFSQNGKTDIFPLGEIAREMFRTRIFESLRHLQEEHSIHIIGKRNDNKEYFKKCFEDYVRSFYSNK